MGKTYRHQPQKFDDERNSGRSGKHSGHSNNKKQGGMRIINDVYDENDDFFDDEVSVTDQISINRSSDNL